MPDTQWPRFYVFEMPAEHDSFILAGSVHAPDAEMALLIARDNFARRPSRTAMWLVRDRNIHSWTREQLVDGLPVSEMETVGNSKIFQVFKKGSHKGLHVHLGPVDANSLEGALESAVRIYGDGEDLVWWLVEDDLIIRSEPVDVRELYESSPGKLFRHERDYPVRTMMMALKNKKDDKSDV